MPHAKCNLWKELLLWHPWLLLLCLEAMELNFSTKKKKKKKQINHRIENIKQK
jgi:uncharacterized protein (DUF983 family)